MHPKHMVAIKTTFTMLLCLFSSFKGLWVQVRVCTSLSGLTNAHTATVSVKVYRWVAMESYSIARHYLAI